jgi:hypothetical protein
MVFVVVYALLVGYSLWAWGRLYADTEKLTQSLSRKDVRKKAIVSLIIQFVALTIYFGTGLLLGKYVFNRGGVLSIFLFSGLGLVGGTAGLVYWIYSSHARKEKLVETLRGLENDLRLKE